MQSHALGLGWEGRTTTRWFIPAWTNVVDYKAYSKLSPPYGTTTINWTSHQSKTKVSFEHRAHNEPKNLSPDITREGLSLPWNTGDQVKNDHNTIGFKRAMLTKIKLTLV
jgi:hypothetical protein